MTTSNRRLQFALRRFFTLETTLEEAAKKCRKLSSDALSERNFEVADGFNTLYGKIVWSGLTPSTTIGELAPSVFG